jgi:hypothetical protein
MKKTKSAAVGKKDKERRNYLTLPEDFEAPKVEDGETFEAVAEIRKEKDGKFCVVTLDGIPLKEEDARDDEEGEDQETIGAGAKRAASREDY